MRKWGRMSPLQMSNVYDHYTFHQSVEQQFSLYLHWLNFQQISRVHASLVDVISGAGVVWDSSIRSASASVAASSYHCEISLDAIIAPTNNKPILTADSETNRSKAQPTLPLTFVNSRFSIDLKHFYFRFVFNRPIFPEIIQVRSDGFAQI